MHAVECVGVQSLAVAHIFQRSALQFEAGANRRGRGQRQQRLDERCRCIGAETVGQGGSQAASGDGAHRVRARDGFGTICQFDYAGDRFSGRRVQELRASELDLRRVDIGKHNVGRQQQRGDARLLHDRVSLAVRGKQCAVGQVEAEATQRVLVGTAVL